MKWRCTSLGVLSLMLLGACAHNGNSPATSDPAKPVNIVFIMADDHAVQAVGAYGHPLTKIAPTPNIDRIARNGMTMRNSFVTNSLCGPSRAALLTGKYGHVNGFKRNGETFDQNQPTWPRALKRAGYQTALVGKWHIGRTPQGLDFDHWKIFDDQGEYYNPDIITADGSSVVEGYASDLVTEFALTWLRTQREPGRPFVLMVQHKAPHRNWMPPLRHTKTFESAPFPVPETYFDDYRGRKAAAAQEMNIYRDMYEGHDLKMTDAVGSTALRYDPWPGAFGRMTPAQRQAWDASYQSRNDAMNRADMTDRELALWKYQRYLQDYLGTIAAVDEGVGRILDYLDAQGLSDDTVVVYTSDQGFFLGEHGWFDKRFMYEESLRTPLLMQLPGRIPAGSTTDAMVMNIDHAPTFLQLAGLSVPEDIQGRSLLPLFEQPAPEGWRESIYYQYFEFPAFHSVRQHYGVRDARYKLIRFHGDDIDAWEFYDLHEDPKEMHNAIDSPTYRAEIARLRDELRRLRDQYDVPADGLD